MVITYFLSGLNIQVLAAGCGAFLGEALRPVRGGTGRSRGTPERIVPDLGLWSRPSAPARAVASWPVLRPILLGKIRVKGNVSNRMGLKKRIRWPSFDHANVESFLLETHVK